MATTHQDTNVNQLVINKMTKQEYDNLSQVSETELYLVEEQVDSVVTQNSTNPVQSGAVYEALHEIGSAINDGTTLFTKNNKTVGTISANQALDKTIKIPNDIIMCKMSDGIVYDSYITYTKVKQYLPDYPYYSDDLDWEIGGNPPMRANITADNYYLDVDTKHIFIADENLELLDITSSVVIHGDSNKLYCNITDNKVYRYNGSTLVPLSNDIVDNLIISNNLAYPLEGTYIGQVESTEPPIFYDRKAADFHTFVSQDNGKYFYDDIDNKVYIYIEQPNQHLYCVSDNELYYLENLDTTKTYLSYKTDKLYRTNNGENFNLIATTDYIDLKNKPLSVESSKVKYTLSDGTTKLTLIQESDYSNIPIEYTPDTTATRDAKDSTTLSGLKSYIEGSNLEGIAACRPEELKVIRGNSGWYEIGEFYLHWGVSAIFDCFIVGNYGNVNWGSVRFTIVVNAFSANVFNVINSANNLTKVRFLTSDGTRINPITIEIYKNNNDEIVPRIRFVGLPTINTRYFVPHNDSKQVWLNSEYSITM